MYKKWKIPRRTFLKGLGASVAIPYLEIMFSSDKAMAQAVNDKNFVMMYFDTGAGNPWTSTHTPNSWYLANQGVIQGNLPLVYSPLNPHKANIHLMTNCGLVQTNDQVNAEIRGDGNEHNTGLHHFATGGSSKGKKNPNLGNQSIDDVILEAKKRRGFQGEGLNVDENNLKGHSSGGVNIQYADYISFKNNGQTNVKRQDPQSVFDSFFANNNNPNPLTQQASQRGVKIVDFIKRDRDRLRKKVSSKDKMILDQYYNSLSEVEDKVKKLAEGEKAQCQNTSQLSAALQQGKREAFTSLMAMAFQCGVAKTGTYMLMAEITSDSTVNSLVSDNDRAFDGTNIAIANSDIHNTIGHGINDSSRYAHNIGSYNHFQIRALARLIDKMKATPTVAGNIFDNTLIYSGWNMTTNHYLNRYTPILLAGGANSGVIGGRCTTENIYTREILATIKKSFGIPENEWGSTVPANTKTHLGKIIG